FSVLSLSFLPSCSSSISIGRPRSIYDLRILIRVTTTPPLPISERTTVPIVTASPLLPGVWRADSAGAALSGLSLLMVRERSSVSSFRSSGSREGEIIESFVLIETPVRSRRWDCCEVVGLYSRNSVRSRKQFHSQQLRSYGKKSA